VNCCDVSIETVANQNKARAICGSCGNKGKKVERLIVEHIVKGEHQRAVTDAQYYFCETPSCDVVYFSNETEQYFTKEDVHMRVGLKETDGPIQVCYCFDFTEQMIRDEFLAKGRTTIPGVIAAEMAAGHCACEVKNPSGRCCLGEVNKSVKRVQAQIEIAAQASAIGNETHNCCALKPGVARPIIQSQEVDLTKESSL